MNRGASPPGTAARRSASSSRVSVRSPAGCAAEQTATANVREAEERPRVRDERAVHEGKEGGGGGGVAGPFFFCSVVVSSPPVFFSSPPSVSIAQRRRRSQHRARRQGCRSCSTRRTRANAPRPTSSCSRTDCNICESPRSARARRYAKRRSVGRSAPQRPRRVSSRRASERGRGRRRGRDNRATSGSLQYQLGPRARTLAHPAPANIMPFSRCTVTRRCSRGSAPRHRFDLCSSARGRVGHGRCVGSRVRLCSRGLVRS